MSQKQTKYKRQSQKRYQEASSTILEEDENPLDKFIFDSQKTLFVSNISPAKEMGIASGERKQPSSILSDKLREKLIFPYQFPNGKFGNNANRVI